MAAKPPGDGAGRARSEERVEHHVAGLGRSQHDARQQRFRLLRRMQLVAIVVLQPLAAGADRKQPVRAHLHVVVGGFQRIVVEGVALGLLVARRPDQRLVRILEAAAAKIRHRIGLAPDDVVEDPEAEILHGGADPEDVVVGADHPDRAAGLEHPAHRQQPGAGEGVIGRKTVELVPVVVDRIDLRLVGADADRRRAADCRAGRQRPRRPIFRAAVRAPRRSRP